MASAVRLLGLSERFHRLMKTTAVMVRVDPKAWKELQRKAQARDLRTAQLLRLIIREWLEADKGKK